MRIVRQTISDTSPAAASTAASTDVVAGLDECETLTIIGELVGATGGTLDVYLQTSFDDGTTWYDFAHFTQLAAGAAAIKHAWHVSRASELSTITTIGAGTSPVLAAGGILRGGWGNRMRALYVAGVGTSAGAAVSITIVGVKR